MTPMPIISEPFRQIAMDIVGPLPKTSSGKQYILVVSDYATQYPEAFALRNTGYCREAVRAIQSTQCAPGDLDRSGSEFYFPATAGDTPVNLSQGNHHKPPDQCPG